MTRFVLALIRTTALALSFILSTLAASLFISFVLFLGSDTGWLQGDPFVAIGTIGFTAGVWLAIAQALFAPFIGIIVLAEFARLSSLMFNLLVGGACALVFIVLDYNRIEAGLPYADRDIWLAAIAAGFVGGFAHWVLAGHRAGRWLGPQTITPPRP